jgi:hypothetical protein
LDEQLEQESFWGILKRVWRRMDFPRDYVFYKQSKSNRLTVPILGAPPSRRRVDDEMLRRKTRRRDRPALTRASWGRTHQRDTQQRGNLMNGMHGWPFRTRRPRFTLVHRRGVKFPYLATA